MRSGRYKIFTLRYTIKKRTAQKKSKQTGGDFKKA